MKFDEAWFSDWSCTELASLAESTNGLLGDVVEVGSWQGKSTIALAAAVAPSVVHAVDTWGGSKGEISELLAGERDVFAEFTANTAGLNIEPFRMDWRDYMASHTGPVRFAFIDALHTYDEVRAQILAFLPRLVPGAVICGDDVHHPPIQRAVLSTIGNARTCATLWFRHF